MKNTYSVRVWVEGYTWVRVDANDEQEARDAALDYYTENEDECLENFDTLQISTDKVTLDIDNSDIGENENE